MDCTACKNKVCRKGEECAVVAFDHKAVVNVYHQQQEIAQAAAKLVDNGRAGSLSRLHESVEFSKTMGFRTIGLAYCYGMENDAKLVRGFLRSNGFKVKAVSCTVGGIPQNEVNLSSNNCKVSCNPIGQARQLNILKPDLVLTMGLCMGHDILFNREIESDTSTLVVKDRVHQNHPSKALNEIENQKST